VRLKQKRQQQGRVSTGDNKDSNKNIKRQLQREAFKHRGAASSKVDNSKSRQWLQHLQGLGATARKMQQSTGNQQQWCW